MAGLLDFLQGASNAAASNVSAPVDGLAWLLKQAGMNIENPVGGSDWMRQKGLTAEPQNKWAGLLGESVGGLAPIIAAAKAPQIAKGLLQGAENLAVPRTMNPQTGAVVWHGSPHKFDKFDSAKIGTGEGAQAYGHGLYLAESKDVAKSYQEKLTDEAFKYKAMNEAKVRLYEKRALRIEATDPARAAAIRADASSLGDAGGALYKVDLPDEQIAKMLDWDKPLSGQSESIQKTLQSLVNDVTNSGADLSRSGRDITRAFNPYSRADLLDEFSKRGGFQVKDGALMKADGSLIPEAAIQEQLIQRQRGKTYDGAGQLYQDLASINGSDAGLSAILRNNGIPGIRYSDGVSRATGGTSNYVVFPGNEGLLSILERNGQSFK